MGRGNKRIARILDGRLVNMRLTAEQSEYFDACARLRGISFTALIRRMFDVVAQDAMVSSILDDDCAKQKTIQEYRWRPSVSS